MLIILQVLILCLGVAVLTGYCIHVAAEDNPKFDPKAKARLLGQESQRTYSLRIKQDHQILELSPAGKESRRLPGDVFCGEIATHVAAAKHLAKCEVTFIGRSQR